VVDSSAIRELLEAMIIALSLLGGTMAYTSGRDAAIALLADERPDVISDRIAVGVAEGFLIGAPLSLFGLILGVSA